MTRWPRSSCLGTQGYHWVLDADIEACFDMIDHTALMDRVRARVKDKRVVALVKAFLKAGIMTETGLIRTPGPAPRRAGVRHEGARCEWIALVGGAADAGNVISGQCLEACPHLGMRRW